MTTIIQTLYNLLTWQFAKSDSDWKKKGRKMVGQRDIISPKIETNPFRHFLPSRELQPLRELSSHLVTEHLSFAVLWLSVFCHFSSKHPSSTFLPPSLTESLRSRWQESRLNRWPSILGKTSSVWGTLMFTSCCS